VTRVVGWLPARAQHWTADKLVRMRLMKRDRGPLG
jgi:hypothetical protein